MLVVWAVQASQDHTQEYLQFHPTLKNQVFSGKKLLRKNCHPHVHLNQHHHQKNNGKNWQPRQKGSLSAGVAEGPWDECSPNASHLHLCNLYSYLQSTFLSAIYILILIIYEQILTNIFIHSYSDIFWMGQGFYTELLENKKLWWTPTNCGTWPLLHHQRQLTDWFLFSKLVPT